MHAKASTIKVVDYDNPISVKRISSKQKVSWSNMYQDLIDLVCDQSETFRSDICDTFIDELVDPDITLKTYQTLSVNNHADNIQVSENITKPSNNFDVVDIDITNNKSQVKRSLRPNIIDVKPDEKLDRAAKLKEFNKKVQERNFRLAKLQQKRQHYNPHDNQNILDIIQQNQYKTGMCSQFGDDNACNFSHSGKVRSTNIIDDLTNLHKARKKRETPIISPFKNPIYKKCPSRIPIIKQKLPFGLNRDERLFFLNKNNYNCLIPSRPTIKNVNNDKISMTYEVNELNLREAPYNRTNGDVVKDSHLSSKCESINQGNLAADKKCTLKPFRFAKDFTENKGYSRLTQKNSTVSLTEVTSFLPASANTSIFEYNNIKGDDNYSVPSDDVKLNTIRNALSFDENLRVPHDSEGKNIFSLQLIDNENDLISTRSKGVTNHASESVCEVELYGLNKTDKNKDFQKIIKFHYGHEICKSQVKDIPPLKVGKHAKMSSPGINENDSQSFDASLEKEIMALDEAIDKDDVLYQRLRGTVGETFGFFQKNSKDIASNNYLSKEICNNNEQSPIENVIQSAVEMNVKLLNFIENKEKEMDIWNENEVDLKGFATSDQLFFTSKDRNLINLYCPGVDRVSSKYSCPREKLKSFEKSHRKHTLSAEPSSTSTLQFSISPSRRTPDDNTKSLSHLTNSMTVPYSVTEIWKSKRNIADSKSIKSDFSNIEFPEPVNSFLIELNNHSCNLPNDYYNPGCPSNKVSENGKRAKHKKKCYIKQKQQGHRTTPKSPFIKKCREMQENSNSLVSDDYSSEQILCDIFDNCLISIFFRILFQIIDPNVVKFSNCRYLFKKSEQFHSAYPMTDRNSSSGSILMDIHTYSMDIIHCDDSKVKLQCDPRLLPILNSKSKIDQSSDGNITTESLFQENQNFLEDKQETYQDIEPCTYSCHSSGNFDLRQNQIITPELTPEPSEKSFNYNDHSSIFDRVENQNIINSCCQTDCQFTMPNTFSNTMNHNFEDETEQLSDGKQSMRQIHEENTNNCKKLWPKSILENLGTILKNIIRNKDQKHLKSIKINKRNKTPNSINKSQQDKKSEKVDASNSVRKPVSCIEKSVPQEKKFFDDVEISDDRISIISMGTIANQKKNKEELIDIEKFINTPQEDENQMKLISLLLPFTQNINEMYPYEGVISWDAFEDFVENEFDISDDSMESIDEFLANVSRPRCKLLQLKSQPEIYNRLYDATQQDKMELFLENLFKYEDRQIYRIRDPLYYL